MLSTQQFPALPAEEERYRQVLSASRVLGTDENNMGDGCSQKLASAKFLRLLLLILIPCICALILLLVILLTFVGVLEKTCFSSNGSEGLTVNGDFEMSHDLLPNMVENSSKTGPTVDLSTQSSSWTTAPLSHIGQMNKNSNIFRESFQENSFGTPTQATVLSHQPASDAALAEGSEDNTQLFATAEEVTLWSTDASFDNTERMMTLPLVSPTQLSVSQKMDQKKSACRNITNSQCQMLPYNYTTVTSVLSIIKSIEMEKFLKFFSYLNRLNCYQHIMLFGCSLALPECISDGDDRTHTMKSTCDIHHFRSHYYFILRQYKGDNYKLQTTTLARNVRENIGESIAASIFLPQLSSSIALKQLNKLGCWLSKEVNATSTMISDLLTDEEAIRHATLQNRAAIDYLLLAHGHGCEDFEVEASCPAGRSVRQQKKAVNQSWVWLSYFAVHNAFPKRVEYKRGYYPSVRALCGGKESFLCASGICIPGKLQCNGYNDCDDWSDEVHCNCSDDVFRCDTGKCLNYTFVCDGYDDCGDLSDEQNCDCNPLTHHQCGEGRCITADWVCDGDHDCIDKSDEINCSCHSQGLVECRNGQCIPSAFQCDGDNDCKDGSDEENCSESQCEPITLELCMNLPYNYTYYPNYLGHRTQKEASISWESSLFPALVQTNCYKYLMFFACTVLVPKCDPHTNQRIPPCRTLCVQSKERCEAVLGIVGLQWPEDTDCTQFPDENLDNQTCLTPDEDVEGRKHVFVFAAFCEESELECANHECVPRELWCDGQADCSDSSDEWDCVTLLKNTNSLMLLTVHRSAAENHVCADEWQDNLSQLACNQMGLGGPSKTEIVIENEQMQDQKWLNLHSDWKNKNASTLQALLVNGHMLETMDDLA
ncbi:hypothetical protein DUI87_09213 [Hirundo rustica rustica]|uniref:FZ domain-containing protein n=1 Tax=Hirundo rustica rustica TaxID=333673 RepID=A0A3M0KRZ4_HIRRU|nr:hypothetical protein DUI87_09213 [Hirundo rustica rustica]